MYLKYREEHCNRRGEHEEKTKSLMKRVKKGEIVMKKTDKSAKL